MKAGVRNRTEAAYEVQLELQKRAGLIAWYRFEAMTLKLADDCRYTPDFLVMLPAGGLECHEVKGVWTDDARVKVKVASEIFPFCFVIVTKDKAGFRRQVV
jgi:hypothetical protein